ncbi:MAG: site-specific DNA-methyltransferase [Thermoanaerobaculaceae bacterium]|jgi:adenine-specific DNA-methyltransferase|nr:site-specific DNA-methyltransferase [Thermoanaerobaculaceae bacterium]
MRKKAPKAHIGEPGAKSYDHPTAESLLRPDVGTQAQFRKKRPPKTYRYDSSLSPALQWDGQSVRERGEWLLACITEAAALLAPHLFPAPREHKGSDGTVLAVVRGLQDAVEQLARLGRPFLEWAGKAERLSFEVPTLPLFVHERLSTKGIIETLKGHRTKQASGEQLTLFDLFGDPEHSITDQVLRAYEYRDRWTNRMILGDSLVVMSSLLEYEGLGGQVQMIYMDPPYGVKFGSNFQPFVRKRGVTHNDDEDLTREPEMVKAYRDTWELGLHSYLTYMRDRLLLARELLAPSGSIFVQISDENLHHVRELMDEVFGAENFVSSLVFQKTSSEEGEGVANTADYLLWFARERGRLKTFPLYRAKRPGAEGAKQYIYGRSPNFREVRRLTTEEQANPSLLPPGWRVCRRGFPLTSQGFSSSRTCEFVFEGRTYKPGRNRHWSISPDRGMPTLVSQGRIYSTDNAIAAVMDLEDIPGTELGNVWTDTGTGSFTQEQVYVVQTSEKVLERCILMTTEPGDVVLDPTCGSGTTAYVAEQWGRRWITIDVSRVPLALGRQRILAATFPWYRLREDGRGPSGGFVFCSADESGNRKADGFGIASQQTLKSLAGEEQPQEIVFRDRPEIEYSVTRVSGPFCVEATIPTPVDWEGDGVEDSGIADVGESYGSFVDRMLEVLRRSPVLHLGGGRSVALKGIRRPAKTLSLSAEASVSGFDDTPRLTPAEALQEALEAGGAALPFSDRPVAIVFGPENGAVAEKLVYEAAREAHAKSYAHLYVIGFAIQPVARELVERCEEVVGVPATYVQATPDLMMGDLLKNMRSSQIFSVCGLPEVKVRKVPPAKAGEPQRLQVELLGLDVFDPATMETAHLAGDDVPAWLLDTDYNGLTFHVCQAFFPRTSAWESLRKALRGLYEESVWDHLAGATSAPFEAGDHAQIAVKVIDDRGNELLVVKKLGEVKG